MSAAPVSGDSAVPIASAVASSAAFGLYPASHFRITNGRCTDCPTIPQALWYFQHETIAVPRPGLPIASFATGVSVADDLRAWLAARQPETPAEYSPLVWVAAAEVIAGARLSADAATIDCGSAKLPATLTPKTALNRSYFDTSSAAFFCKRPVKIRGQLVDGTFAIRTLWPEDFRLESVPPEQALAADLPSTLALRALIRTEPAGGARSAFAASTLWQRDRAREAVPPGRAVLGIMLNGAQGDDDEAHAGHFGLVTGRTQADGAIGDWLVNNFYALDSESEKGILAAPVPLDNYLADLNSGQGWYRPSYLLVAVLAEDRAAALVQAALNRVYNQFWRHQFLYRHAAMNCTGISVDVLRAMGWGVPVRGPASRLVAALGFPFFVVKERSIAKASLAFDYLTEDMTRLMPAAAFEEAGADLIALTAGAGVGFGKNAEPSGVVTGMLATDLDALLFVRFPQFPSSRAFGDAPAVTPWEFHSRVPADPRNGTDRSRTCPPIPGGSARPRPAPRQASGIGLRGRDLGCAAPRRYSGFSLWAVAAVARPGFFQVNPTAWLLHVGVDAAQQMPWSSPGARSLLRLACTFVLAFLRATRPDYKGRGKVGPIDGVRGQAHELICRQGIWIDVAVFTTRFRPG